MPECEGKDLQISRTRANLTQWKLGNACGVSESEIGRWERGEMLPAPDDVDRYADACGDPTLWHRWMLSHYDSYRRRYINAPPINGLSALLTRLRYEMRDVAALQDDIERDAIDGKIDNLPRKAQYIKEVQELQAALSGLLQELVKGGRGDE